MIRFPDLTRRTLAFAFMGGAILFLAGFSYGYAAPFDEFGDPRLTFAE